MSRRGNNSVRGPASALTAFLRDQGISTRPLNTWRRREDVVAEEEENNAEAGPSMENTNSEAGPSNAANSNTPKEKKDGYNSDDLDGIVEKPAPPKKLTKAQMEKEKAKAKAAASKKRKREVDDDEGEEENGYTAPSKALSVTKPAIGSFCACAHCEKRFTVTKYTLPSSSPPGFLCHECVKASGSDPFKKAAAPRKRKAPSEKRTVVNFEEKEAVKSLTSLCIEIVSKNIDSIDVLGDIGTANMQAIARIIAKHRRLTPENVQLFYDIRNTELTIHDATTLFPPALITLASLNPNLQRLRLDFCGRMTDPVLQHYASHLTKLTEIELLGPFLIRVQGWLDFISAVGPRLETFMVLQSPRFDIDCMSALASQSGTSLRRLRLAEVGKLCDDWLPHIGAFTQLTYLDLSNPSQSLTDEPVIQLLSLVGAGLEYLDLGGNTVLTDTVLTGIKDHAPALKELHLQKLEQLTDEAVSAFFTEYSNPSLRIIDLGRNHDLASLSLQAILENFGSVLDRLDINSWKEIKNETLISIGTLAKSLTAVNVGWCREVDDFVIKGILDGCTKISEIKCYGCNRISATCPTKVGVSIFGVEAHLAK